MITLRALAHRLLLLGAVLLASPALAQSLRHEKYTLDNGLTVILHEDHSIPVATVNIWYRVGAQNEPPGRSGFAHLYEHLMFMGTRRVPGAGFDQIMEAGGGSNNASTSLDRTNYYSSGPASLLPTLLWLEADRLEDMGPAMDQAKLDAQRDVVRNEIRQNVENTPYGRAYEMTYRFMYPKDHPYHNAVYGTHEDLEAATVHDVKDFFATFYVPANASLVVAGDFDPAVIKPLIDDLFGDLPAGSPPPRRPTAPPTPPSPPGATESVPRLGSVVRWTMLDKVQLPQLSFVYHSPAFYADGDAEMDLLAAILSDGPSSRLYRRLVLEDQTAVSVAAFQDSAQLSSLFWVVVHARPGADLRAIEAAVDEELARLVEEGPTPDELRQRQATREMELVSSLQSIEARADKLNEYEFYLGNPDSLQRDLERYRGVTPERLRDWTKRVLTPDSRLITTVLPEAPGRTPSARDTRPADLPPGDFTPPQPETFALSNGITVHLWRDADLPIVSLAAVVTGGVPVDPPHQAGRASLMAEMLREGTQDLTNIEFSQALQSLGADFAASAGHDAVTAMLSVLSRNFDPAARLVADALRRPRLAPEDFERVRANRLEALAQQDYEPSLVAARVAMRALMSESSPYGLPAAGTPETVSGLSLDDIRSAHALLLRPEFTTLLVAGDITAEEAKPALEAAFGSWTAPSAVSLGGADASTRPAESMRLLIVDRPGAVQTVIALAAPAPTAASPQRVALRLLNTILGGSFTSRLNQNLREEHGYTYGAGSRFGLSRNVGVFTARTSVQAEVTGEALREFLHELTRIRTGDISDDETVKARETVRNDLMSVYGTPRGTIGRAGGLIADGLPLEAAAADLAAAADATAADLNALAAAAVPLERSVLVLVGDRSLILEQIKGLDLPAPEFVDTRGNPVGE